MTFGLPFSRMSKKDHPKAKDLQAKEVPQLLEDLAAQEKNIFSLKSQKDSSGLSGKSNRGKKHPCPP